MKTNIQTFEDALAYQLQGLFYAEKAIREEFETCSSEITSEEVKTAIRKYIESADDKMLKMKRIFNYLLKPLERKNEVINKLLDETHQLLSYATSPNLKDILMVSCIQKINAYKLAGYRTAYLFAVELEMDTAADLLQEVVSCEQQSAKELSELSLEEFNRQT
jgi:ferritin-like metal-binding protein YciE